MKTEVYSWRLSRELKSGLERKARRRKLPLSAVLDLAALEWLNKSGPDSESEEEQHRLHTSAGKCSVRLPVEILPGPRTWASLREHLRRRNDR